MIILNLTQHDASEKQISEGVIELPSEMKVELRKLLTFVGLPKFGEPEERANQIALLAKKYVIENDIDMYDDEWVYAMIGGAPYLMRPLEEELYEIGIVPVYSFSERISSEKVVNGVTEKVTSFEHSGWVKTYAPKKY